MRLKFNMFTAALSVIAAVAGAALFIFGASGHHIYLKTAGDPSATVASFFTYICNEDYQPAYKLLADYSDLGLQNRPDGDASALLYDALGRSRSYKAESECSIKGTDASQTVRLSFIDISAVQSQAADSFEEVLAEVIEGKSKAELVDENGNYLTSITDEAYTTALNRLLANESSFYTDVTVNVSLSYSIDGNCWLIKADSALLDALSGTK